MDRAFEVLTKILVIIGICVAAGLNYKLALANKKDVTFKDIINALIPLVLEAVACFIY